MPRPKLNRDVAAEIARSYEKFDRKELIEQLAYLTWTYVVNGTLPFNLVGDKSAQADLAGTEKLDFPKLVEQLQRRLPHLHELKFFQVEAGKVTLRAQNQKITFHPDRVASEFVAATAAPPPPPPAFKAPPGVPAAAPAREERAPSLSEAQQEALNDIVTRFKNLELD